MDERRPSRKNGRETQEKRDFVCFVTLMQLLFCGLVFLLLLVLSRGDSPRAQGLRQDYALFLSRQLQMQDVSETVAAVRGYFLPQSDTTAVSAQPEQTTPSAEQEDAGDVEKADAQDHFETTAAQDEPTEAVSAKALKTAASKEQKTKTLSAGGSDAAPAQTKKTAALSPSAVTVPITRPVEGGRYSSYFGYRNNPITHQNAFHTGLDIAVPLGTKIRAAYGGTVRQVGEDSRSGKYVTITHDDGYETFYCHCSEILVPNGTVVRAGEAVACVGSTGWSTGPHLHFEIRKNGTRLDPLRILEHDA